MVPIYESDVAEERWSRTEWNHYELWERVEQRIRRHNRLWIAGTALVFVLLSSIPIVSEQRSKWTALSAARRLGQELTLLKVEAAQDHHPLRLRFKPAEGDAVSELTYQVERVDSCNSPPGTVLRTGSLLPERKAGEFRILGRAAGESLSIPGLLQEFCYDPWLGSAPAAAGENVAGFAVISVRDLAEHRLDRISILLVSGASAELSFE